MEFILAFFIMETTLKIIRTYNIYIINYNYIMFVETKD